MSAFGKTHCWRPTLKSIEQLLPNRLRRTEEGSSQVELTRVVEETWAILNVCRDLVVQPAGVLAYTSSGVKR